MERFLYQVEDKPPFLLMLLLATQHLLAALSGIIAVPLVLGRALELSTADTVILVNAALLISGLVTFIQCKGIGRIGIRLPCVMGTSFTFVAAAISTGKIHGISGVLGASLVGAVVMIIGGFFMPQIRRLFPPVVTGVVVMMIGISLVPVSVDWLAGGYGVADYGAPKYLLMGGIVLVIVIALVQWGKGIVSASAIVIGILVGYIISLIVGQVNFESVHSAAWVAVPQPLHFGLSFPVAGILGMSIAYLVTIVESSGNFLALGTATRTDISGEHLRAGVLCDGIGSFIAALMSTTPFSSFAQNIGVVSLTGVASRHVVAVTGILLMIAGLFPVLGAFIVSIPNAVLGGAGLMMFAMIIAAGIQALDNVPRNRRSHIIIAVSLGGGLAVTTRPDLLMQLPSFVTEIFGSGITVTAILALSLNLILPEGK